MTAIKKVLANNVQALTDAEKARARNNIGTNRVVFVTYGISTQAEISSALSDGDSVILQVPSTGSAAYVPLSHASSAGYVFRSPVSSEKFVEYAVKGVTWTKTEQLYSACKVGIRSSSYDGTTSTDLQKLTVDPGPVTTVTKKSLLIISVYAQMTLKDTSTPADLSLSVQLTPAFKIGASDGDASLSNSACGYSASSATALNKFSSFMTVLDAGQSVAHEYTVQSTVAGFTVSYSINQSIIELE